MGKNIPLWLVLLHNLVSIQLYDLDLCEQTPPLGHLPCLKVVYIRGMESLKCINNEFYGWMNLASAHSSQNSAMILPSLKELTFRMMASLEECSKAIRPSTISSDTTFSSFGEARNWRVLQFDSFTGFSRQYFLLLTTTNQILPQYNSLTREPK